MQERRVERQPSGWRYVLIGALTFLCAASLLIAGLVLGGGAALIDRVLTGVGLIPGPTPAPQIISGDAVVQEIRQISRLETTTYTIERVIEARQSDPAWPDWLRGDRLLLIANGTIIAGVDMQQLQPSDVVLAPDGKSATITLPPVQIFNKDSILNNAKTRVYDRQQGLLAPPNQDLESEARRQAEGQLLQAACEEGIMQRATDDARETVTTRPTLHELKPTLLPGPVPPCPDDSSAQVTALL
jgi:hypothetical protein